MPEIPNLSTLCLSHRSPQSLVGSIIVPPGYITKTTGAHPVSSLQGKLRVLHGLQVAVSYPFVSAKPILCYKPWRSSCVLEVLARIQGYTATCRSFLQGPCTDQTHSSQVYLLSLPSPSPSQPASQPIAMKEKEESTSYHKKCLCPCKSPVLPRQAFYPAGSLHGCSKLVFFQPVPAALGVAFPAVCS